VNSYLNLMKMHPPLSSFLLASPCNSLVRLGSLTLGMMMDTSAVGQHNNTLQFFLLFPKDFLCYIALGGGLGEASRSSRDH
jgi:hypothetical protein